MAQLLGDRLLPESLVSRRRQARERVMDLREPLRRFRESNVPGPDIVGQAEDRLVDLRNRFVSRSTVVGRIQSRRNSSSGDNSSNGSGDSANNQVSTSQIT